MDATTEFWIALGTLVTTGAAAIGGFWVVAQKWHYHPKPVWDIKWIRGDTSSSAGKHPTLQISLTNLGLGTAHDVSVLLRNPLAGELKLPTTASDIVSGKRAVRYYLSLVSGDDETSFQDELMDYMSPPGEVVPMTVEIQVDWRQSPTMRCKRRKMFRYTMTS